MSPSQAATADEPVCDKVGRVYTIGGVRVPSVTDVLALEGVTGFSMVPPALLAQACERGTYIHALTAQYDLGILDWSEVEPYALPYMDAYLAWIDATGWDPNAVEVPVYHPLHRYAGTPDRTGRMLKITPHEVVVDLKSGLMGSATALQTAGYANALPGFVLRYGVQLKPDGTWNMQPFTDRRDRTWFLHLLGAVHYKLEHGIVSLEG